MDRDRVIEIDGGKCRSCGYSEDDLPIGKPTHLQVHHIDPSGPDTLENMVTLCLACHRYYEGKFTDMNRDGFIEQV